MHDSEIPILDKQESNPAKAFPLVSMALALTLPFVETQFYYSLRNTPRNYGNPWFYVFICLFAALTFGIMILCLVITENQFRQYIPRIAGVLDSGSVFRSTFTWQHLKQALVLFLLVILTILITEGWNPMRIILFLEDHIREFIIAAILSFLLPAATKMIYRLVRIFIGGQLEKPLQQVVNDWSLVLLIMPAYIVVFFLFTAGFTNWFSFPPPFDQSLGYYWTSYWKDLVLLSIIAGLYLGTFKLVVHRATTSIFKSPRDFLYFAGICSVIAVMAVHAEFTSIGNPAHPLESGQLTLTIYHVAIRDIGFLMLPIAIYLFWMFRCVVGELAVDEKKMAQASRESNSKDSSAN